MKKMYLKGSLLAICVGVSMLASAQTWSAVGGGVNSIVFAECTYNNNLYVGGDFTVAGSASASYIAEWNGSAWSALGTGVSGEVDALCVYNGKLIVGGYFTTAGGVTVNNIAQWDGTTWTPLDSGFNNQVMALCVYNGNLMATGNFTAAGGKKTVGIAQWNGSSWSAIGSYGLNGLPEAMVVYNGDLIIGGSFETLGGSILDSNLAVWNGIAFTSIGNANYPVYALAVYNNNLVIGGNFDAVGGVSAANIASWNGTKWSAFGSGTGGLDVHSFATFGNDLVAGGVFTSMNGVNTNHVALYNGSAWSSLGTGVGTIGTCVYALYPQGTYLYVGGTFATAGSVSASNIAEYMIPNAVQLLTNDVSVNVYPNPVSDKCTINELGFKNDNRIVMYNILGSKVFETNITANSSNEINISSLSAGMYIYNIVDKDNAILYTNKLIKQ